MQKFIAITWLILSTSCSTTRPSPPERERYAVPVRPSIIWQEAGDRLCISHEEAIALARYLHEVDGYIAKTQG